MSDQKKIDWTFHDEIRQSPIHLARTAFKIAREIAYPDLDVANCLERVDDLVNLARTAVSPNLSILAQSQALASFLFHEQGFRGNLPFYFDPRNSFLNKVLDRRLGIPVTLSILYIVIGESLGLPAFGVGMPGHFIVGVREGEQIRYLDPYHDGQELTIADCAQLVHQTTGFEFQEEWLEPTEPMAILIRMLNNLRNIYVQYQQWSYAASVIELLNQAEPDEYHHLRDLGFVHFQSGAVRLAAHYLEAYLGKQPNAPDADSIQHNVSRAIDEWARLN